MLYKLMSVSAIIARSSLAQDYHKKLPSSIGNTHTCGTRLETQTQQPNLYDVPLSFGSALHCLLAEEGI